MAIGFGFKNGDEPLEFVTSLHYGSVAISTAGSWSSPQSPSPVDFPSATTKLQVGGGGARTGTVLV
jgi:hypothetical protein